jgi:L-lactate dehydrogenase (cytochrome)
MPKFTEVFSLGPVERYTAEMREVDITDEGKTQQEQMSNRPPLDEILNLHDFEVVWSYRIMAVAG